jgi:pSer/pThr/pTyr-binding forkhead associated (FHA) protein
MSRAELVDLASGERFQLEEDVTLGREGCEIVLDDELVSRCHAAVRITAGGLEIQDLDSHNGTFVNGERLGGPRALEAGDTVEIGDVRLRVEMTITQAPRPRSSAARRGGATAVSLAIIAATAVALVLYFADRGL